jgi:hypothetical protein
MILYHDIPDHIFRNNTHICFDHYDAYLFDITNFVENMYQQSIKVFFDLTTTV